MKKEKSCGAVVYRRAGEAFEILLVKHINGGHWSFPKGHVEEGESDIETAYREILEETGISVYIDDAFREILTYSPQKDVIKDVVFFIATPKQGNLAAQPEEIMEARWVTADEAKEILTHESNREVLRRVVEYLNDRIK